MCEGGTRTDTCRSTAGSSEWSGLREPNHTRLTHQTPQPETLPPTSYHTGNTGHAHAHAHDIHASYQLPTATPHHTTSTQRTQPAPAPTLATLAIRTARYATYHLSHWPRLATRAATSTTAKQRRNMPNLANQPGKRTQTDDDARKQRNITKRDETTTSQRRTRGYVLPCGAMLGTR